MVEVEEVCKKRYSLSIILFLLSKLLNCQIVSILIALNKTKHCFLTRATFANSRFLPNPFQPKGVSVLENQVVGVVELEVKVNKTTRNYKVKSNYSSFLFEGGRGRVKHRPEDTINNYISVNY